MEITVAVLSCCGEGLKMTHKHHTLQKGLRPLTRAVSVEIGPLSTAGETKPLSPMNQRVTQSGQHAGVVTFCPSVYRCHFIEGRFPTTCQRRWRERGRDMTTSGSQLYQ